MKKSSREQLTAAELARCCQVDMKTIHNWAARGDLPHFRTPGRHLRFRRADVLDFLRRYGYPIPVWLLDGQPRVTALGSRAQTEPLGESLRGDFLYVACSTALSFLVEVGASPPDVAVLFAPEAHESPPLADIAHALREHPRTRRTRIVTVGAPSSDDALRVATTLHVTSAAPAPLRDALAALVGLGRVTD